MIANLISEALRKCHFIDIAQLTINLIHGPWPRRIVPMQMQSRNIFKQIEGIQNTFTMSFLIYSFY